MEVQKYREINFTLGAPFGKRFGMLSKLSDDTKKSFSEVYLDYLQAVFEHPQMKGFMDEIFSALLGCKVQVGLPSLTFEKWLKNQDDFEKFLQNQHYQTNENKDFTLIPVLSLFPEKFHWLDNLLEPPLIRKDHIEFVASAIAKTLELEWVRVSGIISTPLSVQGEKI